MNPTAPFASGSDTSRAAAISITPHLERLERSVLGIITAFDERGLTCDELEENTGLSHQTASARINALYRKKGLIRDSGLRRKTRSGRCAVVYLANRT